MTGADAQFARAIALEDAGRPEEALEQYRALLAAAPQHADARHNRGLLLARLGRLAEAEQSHREYAALHPDHARAHGNLADVLLALSRYDEAIQALDRALLQSPGDPSAQVRKGVALACLERFAEARQVFAEAHARHPREVAAFMQRIIPGGAAGALDTLLSPENIFLARRFMLQEQCDWTDWQGYVAQMRRAAATPGVALEPAVGFMAQHMPLGDAERHAIMRRIAAPIEARFPALPPPPPRSRPRIRVGVLSPDFHDHLNAYLLRPLFELADRKRFEMHAYSLGPDDGSPARAAIRSAADSFRDLRTVSDQDAALAIRRDDIDILLDVGGHTTGGRFAITAQRPARVQVNYLGYPSSLGSKRVDYAIVDRVVAPAPGEWSEALVYLPSTFFLYDYRVSPQDLKVERRDYGLPEEAFVFCAFHKAAKITPESFDLWAEILLKAPRSVLWFGGLPPGAQSALRAHAAARGLDPARLFYAPREPGYHGRYLLRQRLGDLMLDAVNHNAITTACDALGMGLPLLTLRGSAMSARAGESLLRAAGLPDLVAADREAYVRAAVALATDELALQVVRERLARNRRTAPLFDVAGRVRELERALEQML